MSSILAEGAGFVLGFLYAGLFEYAFHRWVLHRSWRILPYPYQMHTLLHHRIFHDDATYRVQRPEERGMILFEWWQAALLLAAHAPVAWAVEFASGVPVFWGAMSALASYYALYEYLHWCMHNPAGRWIERTRVFQFLDAHHRLHHGRWRWNFNVVLPIGDLVAGTYRPARAVSRPV